MANVPTNDGLDWGRFPSAAQLPNVSGSSTQGDVITGARAYVPDDGVYVCTDGTPNGADWARTGSTISAGGTGAQIGPWTKSAVGVGAAFTTLGIASASTWVAPRAGSITAASGFLSAAAADDTIIAGVFINGAPTLLITFPDDGVTLTASGAVAAGTYTVSQNDKITVAVVGGNALSNTPDIVVFAEFTAA